tara:strand:- start:60 stop:797 length:738 start_codon:yes stop_codon:yes gene_type:complete
MIVNKKQKILGIIGARSGSKGVPDKNIKLFNKEPLMGLIIKKAKKSKYLNRLIISTDSDKYAEVAKSYGAEVPCLRPVELSKDNSPEIDFVKHMLNYLKEKENYTPDIIVRMMITIPFQNTEDIDSIIDILIKDKEADSAVVISEARQHPLKALKIINEKKNKKKLVTYFSDSGVEITPIARQNYEKAYFRGNIIACRESTIRRTNSLTGDLVRFHIIPQERAIDIDNEIDFLICEKLSKIINKE